MSAEQEEHDRELSAKVDALPREVEPGRDLWKGVAARIDARAEAKKGARARVLPLALVATFAAMAAAWAIFFGSMAQKTLNLGHPDPVAKVVLPPLAPTPPAAPRVVVPEETSYLTALSGLRAQLEARQTKLPPANLKAIRVSLTALDTAIATTRASLTEHPDDADLRAELDAEYELEIQTINDVLEWTTRT